MSKDAVATMGEILPDDAGGRDAVHVAVVSCVASVNLMPGQDIGIGEQQGRDYEALATADHIGIVDPYLKGGARKGQRFWLYLYPRSITGLNHQWTHPAFPDEDKGVYARPSEKIESQKWLDNWASQYGYTGARMVDAAKDYLKSGDYLCEGGTFEGESVPVEFWEHFERVTGEIVKTDDKHSFFACSC